MLTFQEVPANGPSGAPPGATAEPAIDWPWRLPGPLVERFVDVQAMLALERGSPAMQAEYREREFAALVAHARGVSAFWRERLAPLGEPPQLARLTAVQPLTRVQLRAQVEREGALAVPPWQGQVVERSTSGSSGIPLKFFMTAFANRMVGHQYLADHHRHGRDPRKARAALTTRPDPHPGQEHLYSPANPWLGEGPVYNRRMTQFPIVDNARWLARINPAYCAVTPVMLDAMLDAYEDGVAPPTALEQVLTLGDTVTPQLRQRTRRLTGASIRDRYSCEELGGVALQCPLDASDTPAYHVAVANLIVEVVDDAGQPCAPGQTGRLLLTGLHHWATPVIRYDIGDDGAMQPHCPACGAATPTLTRLPGRRMFLIKLPSGERRYILLRAKDWLAAAPVREHRLTQRTLQDIDVELVLERALTPGEHDAVLAMLRAQVGEEFRFTVRQVERIDFPPGTKRRDVVSLV